MGKINILTKDIYNRIAAGEVVDRPYSVVKELVENSLDAGATEISIYIEKGGKQLIRVCDNGSGIEEDDMRKAFIPHATSKVSKLEDLDAIATLGFRGEALASISSVSRMEIISATEGNPAFKIVSEGGQTGRTEPAGAGRGTEVIVRDLFYNTPVRAKFLKSDKAEEGDIQSFASRFILGNPEVSFRYYADGKLKLQSYGNGLDEAISQVYGSKVLPQCFRPDAELHGIKIKGYIGNQNFFKPNKSCQSLFLNGRYIVNNIISSAVTNAYASYLMKRQYPFYVLFIDVPAEMVDVNVHPNKADVRFTDGRAIYGIVYTVISGILDGTARAAEFVASFTGQPEIKSYMPDEVKRPVRPSGADAAVQTDVFSGAKTHDRTEKETSLSDFSSGDGFIPPEFNFKDLLKRANTCDAPLPEKNVAEKGLSSVTYDDKTTRGAARNDISEQERVDIDALVYTGSLFNTYLIFEYGDSAYIIDQHAAHERIIYDKLKKELENRSVSVQGMLVPYILSLSADENSFIEENLEVIREMGFDIEPFGINSYKIGEVPADLINLDFKAFFDELLSDISGLKTIKYADLLKDKIAMTACKHAVKGGDRLNIREAETLIKQMGGDMGLKCPHGRPVAVRLTKYQIEKMFKRIV